jgi:hypothetical protein
MLDWFNDLNDSAFSSRIKGLHAVTVLKKKQAFASSAITWPAPAAFGGTVCRHVLTYPNTYDRVLKSSTFGVVFF